MARLLFVVHRAWPYQGGSEVFVHNMATEALRRGHQVGILAGEHQGPQDGIAISNDANWLLQPWDLIIVHGCDVSVQDFVLSNARNIPNPILYMIVLPSGSPTSIAALNNCAYVGWSTEEDLDYVSLHGVKHKARNVRHGINPVDSIGLPGFKNKHNIKGRMFLSCGGYWPNKAMRELAKIFVDADLKDCVLVTTGYDNRNDLMPEPRSNVIPLLIQDKRDVMSAINEADCYLMHSYVEGFGLVLLESMLNQTPWIARYGSGARLLKDWGQTYQSDQELLSLLKSFDQTTRPYIEAGRKHVLDNHLISNTVDDIESVVQQSIATRLSTSR